MDFACCDLSIVAGANTASAAYCGAISYEGCGGCGNTVVDGGVVADGAVADGAIVDGGSAVAGGSYTVMRTVRETVYDQVQETRYRTRNETYYEDRASSGHSYGPLHDSA